jgi:hypothetical protein
MRQSTFEPNTGDRERSGNSIDCSVDTGKPLYLAPYVHACITQGHCVFLDLRRDKYSAVLLPSGEDTSRDASATCTALLAEKLAAQRENLLKAGIVTTDAAIGGALDCAPIEGFEGHIFGLDDQRAFGLTGDAARGLKITLVEMWSFLLASWKASHDLRTRHISRVVEDVRRRKARASAPAAEVDKVRRMTAVYRRLRPWYPRKYLCLYDSLALVEFLARQGAFPLWVFAVQAQPFGAHCWVQCERLLLNEGTEYAGQFTPIMAI